MNLYFTTNFEPMFAFVSNHTSFIRTVSLKSGRPYGRFTRNLYSYRFHSDCIYKSKSHEIRLYFILTAIFVQFNIIWHCFKKNKILNKSNFTMLLLSTRTFFSFFLLLWQLSAWNNTKLRYTNAIFIIIVNIKY